MDRHARSRHPQHCKAVERRARSVDAMAFFNVLASPAMVQVVETLSPPHRERLYPPAVALAMFMQQTLDADGSF